MNHPKTIQIESIELPPDPFIVGSTEPRYMARIVEAPSGITYVPEAALSAEKQRGLRAVEEAKARVFLQVARHARIYWGDAVADQLMRWYEEAQQSCAGGETGEAT